MHEVGTNVIHQGGLWNIISDLGIPNSDGNLYQIETGRDVDTPTGPVIERVTRNVRARELAQYGDSEPAPLEYYFPETCPGTNFSVGYEHIDYDTCTSSYIEIMNNLDAQAILDLRNMYVSQPIRVHRLYFTWDWDEGSYYKEFVKNRLNAYIDFAKNSENNANRILDARAHGENFWNPLVLKTR